MRELHAEGHRSRRRSGSIGRLASRRTTGGSWKKSPTSTICSPPNGEGRSPDMAAYRVDQAQAPRREHRDLVDHQHVRLLDAGREPAIGRKQVEVARAQALPHADPAPGMDGHAVPVGRGDAGRGGIGVRDAPLLQPLQIAVDGVRLAAAGLTGEEDRRRRSGARRDASSCVMLAVPWPSPKQAKSPAS